MAHLTSDVIGVGQDDFISSATPRHPIGTRAIDGFGRSFRYAKAGASDLVAGNCIQSSAIVVNHLANTPPAVSIGDKSFAYTPGATAGALGLYADGYLGVDTTPGNGYTYSVSGHPAISSSTAFNLTLKDQVQIALTTSSRVGLIANPYNGVIQMPATTATGSLVGVAGYIITAAQYGWVQTAGLCSTLISGTPALGAMVMSPSATAGAAIILTTTNLVVAQIVGTMAQIGVDGKNNWVNLKIAA